MTSSERTKDLVFKTAINKRPVQLWGILQRKFRNKILPRLPLDFDARYEQQVPTALQPTVESIRTNTAKLRDTLSSEERQKNERNMADFADGKVTFLNRTVSFQDATDIKADDKRTASYPRLWKLKLDAFEPLTWLLFSSRDSEEAITVIEEWTDAWLRNNNRIGHQTGYLRRTWTPYAVSLRIINWCRYCAWRGEQAVEEELVRAIYKNALFLSNHIEWDVDGNHLVENGAALVVAGIFFEEHEQDWVETGLEVLQTVAETQFCEDGCHFERSPMYHILVLTRLLTVLDLLSETNRSWPVKLESAARIATGFLSAIKPPDRRIPLLNDSVFGEALRLDSCIRYANSVGISGKEPQTMLNGSGYYWLGEEDSRLLLDYGASGPSHLLAHTHNDALSLLAWVDGDRVLTDTGCFDYKPGKHRISARSVEGHNTVQVGNKEPADIGHRFLMSHRIEPETNQFDGDVTVVEGRYRGESGYYHNRRVSHADDWWLVEDKVSETDDQIVSRLHLHPDIEVSGTSPVVLSKNKVRKGQVWPLVVDKVGRTTGEYYPEFGHAETRTVLEFTAVNNVTRYLFSATGYSDVTLEAGRDKTSSLFIDGIKYELPRRSSV